MPSNNTDTPVGEDSRKRHARDNDNNSDNEEVEEQTTPKPGIIQDLFDRSTSQKQQRISISDPVTASPYDGVTTPAAASRIGNNNNSTPNQSQQGDVSTTMIVTPSIPFDSRTHSFFYSKDTKPLDTKIKIDPTSAINTILELLRRRSMFPGWQHITTLLIKANGKQRALDIFKEFYDVPLADLAQHSLTFWSDASNHAAILNYKSSSYGKQALAQLLLASMDTSTSSSISLKLSNPVLHNDGPYIWILYIQEVFPSKLLLTKTITNNITTLTLRSFNNDLGQYIMSLDHFTGFLPDNHCMDTCLEAFFQEMNTHPNETVKSHFTCKSVAYYNSTGYHPDINSLLSQAKELH
jgi:hypothetical protein